MTTSLTSFASREAFKGSLYEQQATLASIDLSLYLHTPEDRKLGEVVAEACSFLSELKKYKTELMENPLVFWHYWRKIAASLHQLPLLTFPVESDTEPYLSMVTRLTDLCMVIESTVSSLSQSSLMTTVVSNQKSTQGTPYYLVGHIYAASITASAAMALHRLRTTAMLTTAEIHESVKGFRVLSQNYVNVFDATVLIPNALAAFYTALIRLQLAYLRDPEVARSTRSEIRSALVCFLESFSHVHPT